MRYFPLLSLLFSLTGTVHADFTTLQYVGAATNAANPLSAHARSSVRYYCETKFRGTHVQHTYTVIDFDTRDAAVETVGSTLPGYIVEREVKNLGNDTYIVLWERNHAMVAAQANQKDENFIHFYANELDPFVSRNRVAQALSTKSADWYLTVNSSRPVEAAFYDADDSYPLFCRTAAQIPLDQEVRMNLKQAHALLAGKDSETKVENLLELIEKLQALQIKTEALVQKLH